MFLVSLFLFYGVVMMGARNFFHGKFFTLQKFAMEKFLCAVVTSMIIYIQNVHFTTSNGNLRFCGQEF